MIELTRKQIHVLRTTIRQAFSGKRSSHITFQSTPERLRVRATNGDVAIEWELPGRFSSAAFAIPLEALAACEGRRDEPVQFERSDEGITLRWHDAGIPQSAQFSVREPEPLPDVLPELVPIDREFLSAMAAVCETTEPDSTRYALNCMRLRGSDGQIAATDGRQALLQDGFSFPWPDDVLIPATGVFASKALRDATHVTIGKTADWMFVRADRWTIALKIEKDRRFPAIDAQIPDQNATTTTLQLQDQDADFLIRATSRLPGAEEMNAPITLDLNGSVVVRAKSSETSSLTDLVLSNSRRHGDELKVSSDRTFLKRAAQLGFREIHLRDVESPAFCRSDRKVYLWALLGKDSILKPDASAVRIESPVIDRAIPAARPQIPAAQTRVTPPPNQPRNRLSMNTSRQESINHARSENPRTEAKSLSELIADGETLRATLRDVLSQTNALIVGLKRQRQQSNVMRTALKSLRAMQAIES